MPNWCFTRYFVEGSETEITDLFNKLSSLPERADVHTNDFGKFWLGNVLGLFGADWKDIWCRGKMMNLDRQKPDVLCFDTQTAWGDCPEVWDYVMKQYKTLKYYFYAEETGNCYYATNDKEGRFFSERYIVDQWGSDTEDYETKEEVMADVAARIGLPVDSWEDMQKKIEAYNKANEGSEICVHEVTLQDYEHK